VLSCARLEGAQTCRREIMRPRFQFGFAALITLAPLIAASHSFAQQQPSSPATPPPASASADPASSSPDTAQPVNLPPPGTTSPGTAPATVPTGKPDKPSKSDKRNSKADDKTPPKTDVLPSPGEALDPHIKKGSEDDIEAVGTRCIGCRGVGNWYSINSEIGMGKQYSMEIEK